MIQRRHFAALGVVLGGQTLPRVIGTATLCGVAI